MEMKRGGSEGFRDRSRKEWRSRGVTGTVGVVPWCSCCCPEGVGIGNILISFWCTTYICIIIAWSLYYLIQSFSYTFPWETCDNYWNNAYTCLTGRENASQLAQVKLLAAQSNVSTQTSVEQYWENRVLQQTDSIDNFAGIQWELLLLLLLAWTITYFALWNGITEARKFVYFCALFPYFLIVVLLIRGLTLKGASTGIYYYLKPDITRLMGTQVWLDAGTQVFYSYGLGFGSLIALGSHNKFNHNCIRDAIVMCFINGSTSILAGFAIFSVLGYLSVTSGKDIAEIAKPGVGLAFLAYPEVASNLPMKQFFAFLFFLMLTILGLDSNVCTLEGLVTSIEDRFPVLRKHKRISLGVICLIFFILGLPMVTRSGVHWLTLVDAYGCSGYALLFVVFWEVVGMKRIRLAVKEMIGFTLPKIADFILMIVSPTISLILFILCLVYYKPLKYPNGADYPLWAITLGWCLSLSSILIIPGYAIYYLFAKKENQSFELMDPKKIKIEFTDIFEGVYRPGDELRGEVRFHLNQPVKVSRKINGPVMRNDSLCVKKTKTRIEHVVYSSKVQYCNAGLDLWKGDYLASDDYAMPFRYTLPSNCMPSFEGQYGSITYKVIVKTDPIWRSKKQCERLFTVLPCFDLTKDRRFANPISKSECQNTGVPLFRCGNVAIECKLSKSGYASGEDILAECSIDNGSTKPVRQAKAELIQHAKFIAYKGGRGTATFLNKKETTQNEMKEHDISVSSSVKDNMSIMPKTKHDFIIKLPVTPTIPSFDQCKIINVEYYVKIKIKTDALMNNSIVTKIPISIGTISIWPAEAPNQPGQPSAPFSENADRQYEIVPMPPPTSTIPSTFPPVHSNSTEQPQIGWSQIPMSADFPPTYDEAMRE